MSELFGGYSLCPPKRRKPMKHDFWCTKSLNGIVWISGCLIYSEFQTFFPKVTKSNGFAKEPEKCKNVCSLSVKEVENLDDGCPENRDLVDPRVDQEI